MRTLIAAAAATCLAAVAAAAPPQATKAVKDQAEFNLYNDVLKEIAAGNFAKAMAGLDAWAQKYPGSDYRDERTAYYVQAYAGMNQPAKALKAAAPLLTGDLDGRFPDAAGQAIIIRLLYSATWAVTQLTAAEPAELAAGENAARRLLAYDRQLPNVSAEQWAQARADMRAKASAALLHIAMLPGMQAMAQTPPDCAAAETAYSKALKDYPDKAVLSFELGRALTCGGKNAEKLPLAIYHFERAAAVDATLGVPTNDPKKVRDYADTLYRRHHGSDEGLAALKEQVKQSAFPPPGFAIGSAAQIAEAQDAEFQKNHPQIAMWKQIRTALAGENGGEYFEAQLKNTAVPPLKGTLVEAKPACRPTQLLVAVPMPDAPPPKLAEIVLKLDKPLAGRPQAEAAFQWEGIPTAFAKEPFLLTMEAETTKIQGLKTAPCTAAPGRKRPPSPAL